jgi:hypothetical protein
MNVTLSTSNREEQGYWVAACAVKVPMLRRSHYVDYMVTDELLRIWKEAVMAQT